MDAALNPPARIQALDATPISSEAVQHRLDDFLANFQARRMSPSKGGGVDTAVAVQLQKLSQALREGNEKGGPEK
jgi:hypothetical protein